MVDVIFTCASQDTPTAQYVASWLHRHDRAVRHVHHRKHGPTYMTSIQDTDRAALLRLVCGLDWTYADAVHLFLREANDETFHDRVAIGKGGYLQEIMVDAQRLSRRGRSTEQREGL